MWKLSDTNVWSLTEGRKDGVELKEFSGLYGSLCVYLQLWSDPPTDESLSRFSKLHFIRGNSITTFVRGPASLSLHV